MFASKALQSERTVASADNRRNFFDAQNERSNMIARPREFGFALAANDEFFFVLFFFFSFLCGDNEGMSPIHNYIDQSFTCTLHCIHIYIEQ